MVLISTLSGVSGGEIAAEQFPDFLERISDFRFLDFRFLIFIIL